MKTDTNVNLNVQELGVLLSALELLEHVDECHIAKDYGSAPSLYNRLKEIYNNPNHLVHHNYVEIQNRILLFLLLLVVYN